LQRTNTAVGNLITNYKIAKNISFRSLFGLDYRLLQGDNYRDPRTPDGAGVIGRSSVQSDWRTRFITTQTLNWNKTFNGVHNVSALAGVEYLSETREGISGAGIGFPTFQFRTIQSAATPESITGFWTGYRRASAFSSVNYDYKKKYLVTVTARYDGSSRFGTESRRTVVTSSYSNQVLFLVVIVYRRKSRCSSVSCPKTSDGFWCSCRLDGSKLESRETDTCTRDSFSCFR